MSLHLGIDPGLDGAVVAIDDGGEVVFRSITPTVGVKGSGKRAYDIPQMVALLEGLSVSLCVLEKSQAMPGQGVSSTFSIGLGSGLWQGILTALKIPFVLVAPQRWQKEILADVDRSDTKKASIVVAQRLCPTQDWRSSDRSRVPNHNLTDAFCMAVYGRRCNTSQ